MAAIVAATGASVFGVSTTPAPGVEVVKQGDLFVITKIFAGSEVWYVEGQVGDTIVEINDRPSSEYGKFPDRVISMEIIDAANSRSIRAVVRIETAEMIRQAVTLLLLAVVFASMSMFMFIRAERTTEVVLFAMFTASVGVTLAIGPSSLAGHAWGRIYQGMAISVSSIYFVSFFFVFARDATGRQRTPLRVLPELSTALALVASAMWLAVGTFAPSLFPALRSGTLILLGISFLTVLVLLPWRYIGATASRREQLRIATFGTVVGLFPFIWLSIIPIILTGKPIIASEVSILAIALLPLSFGYSILRNQLLGISRLVHRGATYALITGVIVLVYGSVLTALNLFAEDYSGIQNIEVILLVTMFAGVPLIAGVRTRAVRLADRLLYPDLISRDSLIDSLSILISSENGVDKLQERTIRVVGEGLNVGYAITTWGSSGRELVSEYGVRPSDFEPVDLDSISENPSGITRATLARSDVEYLIGSLRGIDGQTRNMVLGPRIDGAPFDSEDIRIFQLACGMVSGALARSQLAAEIDDRQHQLESMSDEVQQIQEDERAELSSYLHDEPLQKVAYALAQMRERSLPEDLAGVLEDVAKDLRSTSANLSPEILRQSGLSIALNAMLVEQRSRSDFNIFTEFESISESDRFGEDIELALYRSAQEALNNARKHAEAKSVWIRMAYDSGSLNLSVDDNGVGLKDSEADPASFGHSLGLRGLERRITQLGGSFSVTSRVSRGTSLTVKIPAEKI